jgi:hypothetical protein|tara:strand:- start:1013 stop:1360 length:348 start_codon:yes stop_codon:yes gene_type:complete
METLKEACLVEPGMKYFMDATLKQCKANKNKYYTKLFNFICLIVFLFILGIFLFIRYKGKITPIQKQKKMDQQRHYILSKIKQFQNIKSQQRQELITNLPKWESDLKILNDKFYK